MALTSDKAKEIVLSSVRRIVKVEDVESWLQHNQTAYQLAMDVALYAYYQAKDEEAEKFREKVFGQIKTLM